MKKILITTLVLAGLFGVVYAWQGREPAPQVEESNEPADGSTREKPKTGKKLNLSNQQLTRIPDSVFTQTDLEELDVSNNRLEGAIQAEIRHLKNLKVLDASNNQMTGVPAEVGQLQNLEVLDLSNNRLTGLPYELGNLKKLQTLNISGNTYSKLDLSIIERSLPQGISIIK